MERKTASELFRQVDPHLTVIDGGTRHYNKRRPQQLTNQDWEASGGAVCPRCKEEVVRFRPQDGVCRQCANLLNEKQDRDEKKHAKFLRLVKAHNARVDKRKRATY